MGPSLWSGHKGSMPDWHRVMLWEAVLALDVSEFKNLYVIRTCSPTRTVKASVIGARESVLRVVSKAAPRASLNHKQGEGAQSDHVFSVLQTVVFYINLNLQNNVV